MNNQTKKTFRGLSMREWKNWAIGYAIALPAAFLGGTVYHNSSAANAPKTETPYVLPNQVNPQTVVEQEEDVGSVEVAPSNTQGLEAKLEPSEKEKVLKSLERLKITPPEVCYRQPVILIDPGHGQGNGGGKKFDPGAVAKDPNGKDLKYTNGETVCEAGIVLPQALRIGNALEKAGYKVFYTRTDNTTPTGINDRVRMAKKVHADLSLSLHQDGSVDPNARGVSVVCQQTEESKKFARLLEDTIVGYVNSCPEYKAVPRGIDARTYEGKKSVGVLRENAKQGILAVLTETGFMTNTFSKDGKIDLQYLTGQSYLVEQAIVDATNKFMQEYKIPEINKNREKELQAEYLAKQTSNNKQKYAQPNRGYSAQKNPSKAPKSQPYSRGRR